MTEKEERRDARSGLSRAEVANLYREHAESIRWFLMGLCGRNSHVDDYVQQVFVIASERGGSCRPGARRAWLFRVAVNLVNADRRREAGRERILMRIARQDREEAEASDVAISREEQQRLVAAIGRLTPCEQQLLELRIRAGLTFQETADRLGIPLGTALTRMRTIVLKLQRQLGAEDELHD